jgi:hypothetical protein
MSYKYAASTNAEGEGTSGNGEQMSHLQNLLQDVYLKGLIASIKGCALIFQVIDAILTIERQTYEAVCQLLGFEGPN